MILTIQYNGNRDKICAYVHDKLVAECNSPLKSASYIIKFERHNNKYKLTSAMMEENEPVFEVKREKDEGLEMIKEMSRALGIDLGVDDEENNEPTS